MAILEEGSPRGGREVAIRRNPRILTPLLAALLVLALAQPAATGASATWSSWYNLPRTEIDVRYRVEGRADADDQHQIRWQFRNRHGFKVSFAYGITFQHKDGDRLVTSKLSLSSGERSPTERTSFRARQLLNVKLTNVVREDP